MLDVAMDCFNEGMVPQSAWDSLASSTKHDEGIARCTDYTTLQEASDENDTSPSSNNCTKDIKGGPLTKLYTQVARRSDMTNAE